MPGRCRKKQPAAETYLSPAGETRAHLLAKMARPHDAFLRKKGKPHQRVAAGQPARGHHPGFIVEKENRGAGERRMSPAIFNTRLKMGMRLQPTPPYL